MPVDLRPKPKRERVVDPNHFDMITHETDSRGRVRGTNLYRLHQKDGNSYFERPVGSGNLFYENNEPAGRVIVAMDKRGRIVGKKYDFEAAHVAFKKPIDAQTELEQKLMDSEAKNAAMAKELAAIRAEQAAGPHRVVGDETHTKAMTEVGDAGHQDGVSRSVKDSPLGARLTEPKSSSTPVNPESGHAVPVSPLAEVMRDAEAAKNADQTQDIAKGNGALPESDGKAHAPRPGPTPGAVHAKQAAAEPPRPATGPGSGPTPPNVHAARAREEAKKNL